MIITHHNSNNSRRRGLLQRFDSILGRIVSCNPDTFQFIRGGTPLRPHKNRFPNGVDHLGIGSNPQIQYGTIKATRLQVKNERRIANGLTPLASYSQI